jgi:hypothetical protein
MQSEAVHIFKDPLKRYSNIYLLFIPILIFVLVLSFFLAVNNKTETASVSAPDVLGEEARP